MCHSPQCQCAPPRTSYPLKELDGGGLDRGVDVISGEEAGQHLPAREAWILPDQETTTKFRPMREPATGTLSHLSKQSSSPTARSGEDFAQNWKEQRSFRVMPGHIVCSRPTPLSKDVIQFSFVTMALLSASLPVPIRRIRV